MGSTTPPKMFAPNQPYGQSPTGVTSQAKAPVPLATGPGSASIYGTQAAPIPESMQPQQQPLNTGITSPAAMANLRKNLLQNRSMPFYGQMM